MRLCLDLKSSGYNDSLYDWPFRYRSLDAVAEKVQQNDYLATLDISRFYLRLPAAKDCGARSGSKILALTPVR